MIHPVTPKDEPRLIAELRKSLDENAYLLGLIADYSLLELDRMPWGRFYWYEADSGLEGTLYADITGLLVLTPSSSRAMEAFAEMVVQGPVPASRIIARIDCVSHFYQALSDLSSRWRGPHRTFDEYAMLLHPADLPDLHESQLRCAEANEARAVAEGSAAAMKEELGLRVNGEDFESLVRSKNDLIRRRRYFVLEEGGRIVFQAYLSACLPEVGQIQGVWVPPESRCRGTATRCLAEMCRRSMDLCNHFVLRVQKANLPAVAVYLKLGFKPFLDSRSVWLEEET